ncbi:MAG TPA: IS1634 family transposase, partial [Chitinophagaceae bacterium]|nr:IS1634 family transposase [Chitinophagaceae bacterium]
WLIYVATMFIDDHQLHSNGKSYRRVLVRESYREGKAVKKRTMANLSNLPDDKIEAIKIAFQYAQELPYLKELLNGHLQYDKIVGPGVLLYQVMGRLGITAILGNSPDAACVLWMIMARLINQGSRLSAVRLAQQHYGCEWLNMTSLNENMLYAALDWLYEQYPQVEKNIYQQWGKQHQGQKPEVFLYDVSSSYLEGQCNELADYGYNRDKKKGKKQIVYGLLTDAKGNPLAIEAFRGNTTDTATIDNQIEKLKSRYGCRYITLVGDKGMLKSIQIDQLGKENYRFISSITKPQIESLIIKGVIQLELFTDQLAEVYDSGSELRYILKRNPVRAAQVNQNRQQRIQAISIKVNKANDYLKAHPRASVPVQQNHLNRYIGKLKLSNIITVQLEAEGQRSLRISIDQDKLDHSRQLDGCYVVKTDLKAGALNTKGVHDRYKDLSKVEWAFRTEKSSLEIRPIYLRSEARTRAYLLVCMFAYMIEKYLRATWSDMNITVQEGMNSLARISAIKGRGNPKMLRVLEPDEISRELLEKAAVKLPTVLPVSSLDVVTYKALQKRR